MIKMNYFGKNNTFFETGIPVAQHCGFKVPTRVNIGYLVEKNHFMLDIVSDDGADNSDFICDDNEDDDSAGDRLAC